jgi:peptidyl-Lys metalloendopeptidase
MKKFRLQSFVILALLTALLMVVGVVGATPKDGPLVSLSASQGEFSASQDVLVTVTISNPARNSVRILKWFTPADGVEEPLFSVKRNGQTVSYTGAIYKRPAATGNDYITLKAGESITRVVNLGDYYDFTTTGQYEVFYSVASFNLLNEKSNSFKVRDSLSSETLSLKVDGRAAKGKPTPPPPPTPGGNSYEACSESQQSDLIAARAQAKAYSLNSKNYLSGNNYTNPRYSTWFGTYTSSRYTTVQNHFNDIYDAFNTAGVNFNCGCKQNYYAYVYPNQPYNIYLCRVFWTAPLSGTDSKAGTLIHEMSHFDVVAGTDDFVYGQTGAKNLAISNPNDAVKNADNHEYFAENTPALP